jgi:3-dehydroquinate synthase
MMPRWLIEGIAVYEESKRSAGGRNRGTRFDEVIRIARDGHKDLKLDEVSGAPRQFPRGNAAYVYGSHFLRYIFDRFGDDTLRQMSHISGSFAPPFAVVCDFELLLTLSDRDWRSGVSEAIKVALLRDPAFFAWIEDHVRDLLDRSLDAMAWLVHRSAELHLNHIASSGDPFELGSSRPLDFGHWAAHKLEQLSGFDLRHGEAVSIGIALDSTYSHLAGHLPRDDWRRILELFRALSLPTWTPELVSADGGRPAVLDGMDEFREHLGGRLTVMLLAGIGSPFEVHSLADETVLEAVSLLRRRAQEGGEVTPWRPTTALAR